MRSPWLILSLACAMVVPLGCLPDKKKEPEWRKPPKDWNPQGDTLTFGQKGLESFNAMLPDQREAYVQQLMQSTGTFRGQAIFKGGAELGDGMNDVKYGRYEVVALVPDPVLWEITVAYRIYCTPEMGRDLPPNSYLEFTGTLAELVYQSESKPRKLDLKVKADSITVLQQN